MMRRSRVLLNQKWRWLLVAFAGCLIYSIGRNQLSISRSPAVARRLKLYHKVSAPYGAFRPVQPMYFASIESDGRVKQGDRLTFTARFGIEEPAREYIAGPIYWIFAERRFGKPEKIEGNFQPLALSPSGELIPYDFYQFPYPIPTPVGWIRAWAAYSPSSYYNQDNLRRQPNAWGKFKVMAIVPSPPPRGAVLSAHLEPYYLNEQPMSAIVYPVITPNLRILEFKVEPEHDTQQRSVAMRIGFYLSGNPNGFMGKIEVRTLTGAWSRW